jgi:hypothetical protein
MPIRRRAGTCRASGLSPAVANRNAPSQTAALGIVAAGVGVSLVWECMRNLRRPGVVYRPLNEQTPSLEAALAWKQDNQSPVLAAFLALAREFAIDTEELEARNPTRTARGSPRARPRSPTGPDRRYRKCGQVARVPRPVTPPRLPARRSASLVLASGRRTGSWTSRTR